MRASQDQQIRLSRKEIIQYTVNLSVTFKYVVSHNFEFLSSCTTTNVDIFEVEGNEEDKKTRRRRETNSNIFELSKLKFTYLMITRKICTTIEKYHVLFRFGGNVLLV